MDELAAVELADVGLLTEYYTASVAAVSRTFDRSTDY